MHLDLPYHSRRDELGGVIDHEDWKGFIERLEGVIDRVKKKRKRIIKRRKKKGKKLMPRATLFKPQKKINLAKNPLWMEVFANESSDEDSSDVEAEEFETFKMYKKTMQNKGITTQAKHPRQLMKSAQSERVVDPNKNYDINLPPIDGHKTNSVLLTEKKKQLTGKKLLREIEENSPHRKGTTSVKKKGLSLKSVKTSGVK